MIHYMKLKEQPFEAIKSGTKTIEMRLYDDKRSKLQLKDIIQFENMVTGDKIKVQVVALHIVPTFEYLYNMFEKSVLGYKEYEIAHYTDMEMYYPKTEIEKYGAVGIGIRLIES